MSYKLLPLAALLLIPTASWSRQDNNALSAKALYYQADDDEKPAPKPTPRAKPAPPKPVPSSTLPSDSKPVLTPISSVTEHLGLRYNLLLVDRKAHKSTPVDPGHVFEPGDCLQLQFAPNRDGYLYVFDRGSSGKWEVLLPSALMSDEMNVIRSRTTIKVPANYCFTVQNPAGSEHLFVVLSRSQEDMYSLDKAIRSRQSPSVNVASQTDKASPVEDAANRLDAELQKMQAGLNSRDLGVEKIDQPDQPDEPADSVYVVNTSTVSSSRLVTEIVIRHK